MFSHLSTVKRQLYLFATKLGYNFIHSTHFSAYEIYINTIYFEKLLRIKSRFYRSFIGILFKKNTEYL